MNNQHAASYANLYSELKSILEFEGRTVWAVFFNTEVKQRVLGEKRKDLPLARFTY